MQKHIGFLIIIGFLANWAIAQNVGIGTSNPRARLHVADSSVLFAAPATLPANAGNTPVTGPGHRMMWFANKAALRLGRTTGNQSDAAQVGQLSFAAGQDNIVSGFASAAFGTENKLSSGYNFAAGYGNETRSVTAAAFGFNNLVKAQHGFAIGLHNDTADIANPNVAGTMDRLFQIGNGSSGNNRSNAITILRNGNTGIGTVNPAARLHVADSSVVFTGSSYNENTRPPVEGTGSRMLWFASRFAFRSGFANSTEWNRDSIGMYSFATGFSTKATGGGAAAFGDRSEARGLSSFASGEFSKARGQSAVAMGFVNTASGVASLAIGGTENRATGDYSTAIGFRNTAGGEHAQAFGNGTIASGTTATTFGYQTQATNNDAMAIGQSTIASGIGSFAAGNISEAKGTNSMALGYNAIAQGSYSTALGYSTRANGSYATAIGFSSVAEGANALATGQNTSATGAYSSSFGLQTTARALGAMTVGVYNDNNDNPNTSTEQSTDRLFQIGNGNSTTRSNAITVLRNGYTGVGVTDPAYSLDISTRMRIRGAPGYTAGLWLNNEANTAIPAFIGMYTDNLVGFYGSGVGWGFVMNTTTGNATLSGSLTQNSDARLKKDIVPLSNALEAIQQLNGYSYHWQDASNPDEQIGLLAQEIQKVYPQLVKTNNQGTLSVNYSGMVPVLLEAIKEQQKQSEKQQEELNTLKKLVQQLINTKQ